MENTVRLPQLPWQGESNLVLNFPEDWQVEVCNMAGHSRKPLSPAAIREAVRNPLGSPPIRSLAGRDSQVVIIFDDAARCTRISQIVPFILEELAEAGVPDSHIRFVGATGCHGIMNRLDFVRKLGEEVLRRFPVFNHNAFGHCVKAGTTSFGTEIFANGEVMSCDLKIAVGSITPHPAAGFGGGGKIILPGICSFETNLAFHGTGMELQSRGGGEKAVKGKVENNPLRLNMEEAVRLVGLNIKIDTVINTYGEIVAVYAGKPEAAYAEAVRDARVHYLTLPGRDKDMVIANSFAKVSEPEFGLEIAYSSVKQEGGEVVLVSSCPEGHIQHYLFGAWGTTRHRMQASHGPPPHVKHVYVLNPYPDLTVMGYFNFPEKVSLHTEWVEVLSRLQKSHNGRVQAAVYPGADIQYCQE